MLEECSFEDLKRTAEDRSRWRESTKKKILKPALVYSRQLTKK